MSDLLIGELLSENYSLEELNDIMYQVECGKTVNSAILSVEK